MFLHEVQLPIFSFLQDEKEKYDPNAFRDSILQGFSECDSNLEQVRWIFSSACTRFEILAEERLPATYARTILRLLVMSDKEIEFTE